MPELHPCLGCFTAPCQALLECPAQGIPDSRAHPAKSNSLLILLQEMKMALCLPECVFPAALLHGKLSWAAQENSRASCGPQQKLSLTQKQNANSNPPPAPQSLHLHLHLHMQVRRDVLGLNCCDG